MHTYLHLPINPKTSKVCSGARLGPSPGKKDALFWSTLLIAIPPIPLWLLWVSQWACVLGILETMQTFHELLEALVAKAYYSKKIPNRSSKGKIHKVEPGEVHAQTLLPYLHQVRGQSVLSLPAIKNAVALVQCFCLGSPFELSTQGFSWGWSYQHPLPSMYQDSRLSEGKQGFNINYIVCTNSLGVINHPYALGNGSNAKFPDARAGKDLQALLRVAASGLLC